MKRITLLTIFALCVILVAGPALAQQRKPREARPAAPSPLINAERPTSGAGGSPFCSSPELAIPDNVPAGVSDTQTIGSSFTLTDLNVSLMVSHTFIGDLRSTLTHDDTGTSVTFLDRPGEPDLGTFGCGGDDIDASYDDEGTDGNAEDVCNDLPAHSGSLVPGDPPSTSLLSAFDGENVGGDWTLNINDNAGADTGTLHAWCIETDPVPVDLMEFSID